MCVFLVWNVYKNKKILCFWICRLFEIVNSLSWGGIYVIFVVLCYFFFMMLLLKCCWIGWNMKILKKKKNKLFICRCF